jgi:hypothetical protein
MVTTTPETITGRKNEALKKADRPDPLVEHLC